MRGIGSGENVAGRDPAREPADFIGINYAIDNLGGALGVLPDADMRRRMIALVEDL